MSARETTHVDPPFWPLPPKTMARQTDLLDAAPRDLPTLAAWLRLLPLEQADTVWVAATTSIIAESGDLGGLARVLSTVRERYRLSIQKTKTLNPEGHGENRLVARAKAAAPRVGDRVPLYKVFPQSTERKAFAQAIAGTSIFTLVQTPGARGRPRTELIRTAL